MLSMCRALRMSLMPMIFSWWKRSRILISLSVRWQYVWCSNGLIFLMATRWLVTLSTAELDRVEVERSTKQVSYYTLYNSCTMTLSETGLTLISKRALQTANMHRRHFFLCRYVVKLCRCRPECRRRIETRLGPWDP